MPTAPSETQALHHVRLPRQLLRQTAMYLNQLRGENAQRDRTHAQPAVKVVCISDTHNLRPEVPSGDLLLHAGDLTECGSFDEIQGQLAWLSSQPHQHKLLIAGNHDLLLDDEFLDRNPGFRDAKGRTRRDLDFRSVIYLQDESVTLNFAGVDRVVKVYGSPWTPQYGNSAFQYPRDKDIWSKRVPSSTDILITHGPPAGFNDVRPSGGCAYLRREFARVRPGLMIFGHIHVARGEQTVTFDSAQLVFDDIMDGSRGWKAILLLSFAVAWSRIRGLLGCSLESTRLINAAVVDGMKKDVALHAFEVVI